MSDGKKLPIAGQPDPLERLLAGDSAEVIASLEARVAADAEDEVAWLQLGAAFVHVDHWADAARALARAVELDGSVLLARRLYARALGRLRRHDEAVFQLVQAKRLAPGDARVAHELGVAFYDKRLHDKALAELGRAADLAPDDARIRYAIGLAHEAKGSMADALAAYRKAVELDPNLVDVRRTLADALAAMGEMAAAVRELELALRCDRTNMQIATNLEVLQKALRDLEAAKLIGHGLAELERSQLLRLGGLARVGESAEGDLTVVRYGAPLCELWAAIDAAGIIRRLMLLLTDPGEAARLTDHPFSVTVLSRDGAHRTLNYATAATLTFLREALGLPLTKASELYAELLRTRASVTWGGARLSLAEVRAGAEARHGLVVEVL